MKILQWCKDGGPDSTVSGLFVIEIKRWFSIVLLRFSNGTRDAYHSHAFNAYSWVLKGKLIEKMLWGKINAYGPSLHPIYTGKDTFHKVQSIGTTWVLSFRGKWKNTWQEYTDQKGFEVLQNGRRGVS